MLLIYTVQAFKYIIETHLNSLGGKPLTSFQKCILVTFKIVLAHISAHMCQVYSFYMLHAVD